MIGANITQYYAGALGNAFETLAGGHRLWSPGVYPYGNYFLGDTGVVVLQVQANFHLPAYTDPVAVALYGKAMRSFLRFLCSAALNGNVGLHDMGPAGAWTTVAHEYAREKTLIRSTTGNSTYTFTSNGDELVIGYMRWGAGALTGITVGSFSVTVDGVTQASNVGTGEGFATAIVNATSEFVDTLRLTGLGAGDHTVVITKDASTLPVHLDYWTTPHGAKPGVVIVKEKGIFSSTFIEVDLDAIAASSEFAGIVYLADLPAWNDSTMTMDGLHPNDRGNDYIATQVVDAMSTIPERHGIQAYF